MHIPPIEPHNQRKEFSASLPKDETFSSRAVLILIVEEFFDPFAMLSCFIMNKALSLFIILALNSFGVCAQSAASSPRGKPLDSSTNSRTTTKPPLVLPPEKSGPVKLNRFEKAPVIDGRVDEEVWRHATVLKDFYQIQPGDNIPPSKPTEVLLGYDSSNLYLAFIAHDDPGKVRATVSKRDAIFDDDFVGIILDTFNDQRRAYEVFFNPLGVQGDGIFTEGRGDDFSVDIVMDSKGVVTDDGYTVEVSIPFKSLRYEAGSGKLWGVQAVRVIKRFNNEQDTWMPVSRDRSGQLNQEGRITSPENIFTERTLEIIPSITLSETGRRVRPLPFPALQNDPSLRDPGRFVNEPLKFDPGVTVKFAITPTVILDLAVNPDFAQVEADERVVTANQRFPIFFEEKRLFFLEGIDIFRTPLTVVHTRAIIDPDIAVKLSGKRGRNTFGLLLASDNAPGNFSAEERLDPVNFRFLDKNAYIGVLRLKRDIGKESSLGLIATTYNFIQRHNQLGGVDGRFRLNPQTTFSFQVIGTTSRRFFFDPNLGQSVYRTGNAFGYSWNLDKSGRHFGYNLSGLGRTRFYRADVGFTRRTNTNVADLLLYYNSEPKPKAKIISRRISNNIAFQFDWQGRMQYWNNETQAILNLRHQTFLSAGFNGGYERLFEEEFGPKRNQLRPGTFAGNDPERSSLQKTVFFSGGTTPSKKYSTNLLVSYGWGQFDFDFGAGPRFPRVSPAAFANPGAPLDPGPGRALNIQSAFTYQPTDALRMSLFYTKSKLTRDDTGRVAFDDNIYALRATYQFTRFIFARARVDYDTLASNVLGQFLLGWTPNPGTAIYVGYNNNLNYNGFSPFTAQLEPGFRRNGQTFFLKMSYLFRHSFSAKEPANRAPDDGNETEPLSDNLDKIKR
ncbi:MAG: carbohydrate binding family 9 domain-containing protein [Pyrinomonadaceae bacterium]